MMFSGEKIWEIIQNKANISGTWRHYRHLVTSFSEERVFIVIHENSLDYTVRVIVFDKPRRLGYGVLKIFKVSDYWTLSGAKENAAEMENKLKNLEYDYSLPIATFLNNESYRMDTYVCDTVSDKIRNTLYRSTWNHDLYLSVEEADDYLRPFDIIKTNRIGGVFKHVGVYLGKGYICHFSGSKIGSSGSNGLKVEKDTLRNFFNGEQKGFINIARPVVKFKNKEKIIEDVAKVIACEYGKYQYDIHNNNCEHFANMIILGINYSGQWGAGLKAFTSQDSTILKEEIRECKRFLDNLTSSSNSKVQDLVKEIKELTQEESTHDGWYDWEARIEVDSNTLNNIWCKIQ